MIILQTIIPHFLIQINTEECFVLEASKSTESKLDVTIIPNFKQKDFKIQTDGYVIPDIKASIKCQNKPADEFMLQKQTTKVYQHEADKECKICFTPNNARHQFLKTFLYNISIDTAQQLQQEEVDLLNTEIENQAKFLAFKSNTIMQQFQDNFINIANNHLNELLYRIVVVGMLVLYLFFNVWWVSKLKSRLRNIGI